MAKNTQYNQPKADGDTSPVPSAIKPRLTKSPAETQVKQLEQQLIAQHQDITKLRREVSRLKSQISDIVTALKNG
jgi:TolA-binding protein